MRKLLVLISVIILFSGCSKDSSTKNWDYSTGLKKGDVVEFKVFPETAATATINSILYSIDYSHSTDGKYQYICSKANPIILTFTAQRDNQGVYLQGQITHTTKIILQITVNGKVIDENYLDATYPSSSTSVPKGLRM